MLRKDMTSFFRHDQTHPQYRPDIDGLRALAIILVVAFHAFPSSLFKGGFIGVDVFFVISGFLISSIIFKSLDAGSFSLGDFYLRRIRRIFPALLTVLSTCVAIGGLFLFPTEVQELGKHLFKACLFILNFSLMKEKGYFDTSSDLQPLLHLWSLCIEEQFYLLWPLLAFGLWKLKPRLRLVSIMVMLAGSFAWNILLVHAHPTRAFYLPATRFWELWLGSVTAYLSLYCPQTLQFTVARKYLAHIGSVLGFALILLPVLMINKATPFPGWWALCPTLGTCLIIAMGGQAWVNRKILGHKWALFIGIISYPLYLWHWPLLAFSRILVREKLHTWFAAIVVLAAVLLAWMTYRLVETPIRSGQRTRRQIITLIGLFAVLCGIGAGWYKQILPLRLQTPAIEKILAARDDWSYTGGNDTKKPAQFALAELKGDDRNTVLVIGDSHAEHWFDGFKELQSRQQKPRTVLFATYGGCVILPLLDLVDSDRFCSEFYHYALEKAQSPDVKTVVFSAKWESYFHPDIRRKSPTYLTQDPKQTALLETDPEIDDIFHVFAQDIQNLISQGKHVYLILANPTSPANNPKSMVSRFSGTIRHTAVKRADVERQMAFSTRHLEQVARDSGALLLNPLDAFCNGDDCPTVTTDGRPVYRDDHHIRPFYAVEKDYFLNPVMNTP